MNRKNELMIKGIELAEDDYSWEDAKKDAGRLAFYKRPTWDRSGLDAIASVAIADFERETDVYLPHNLSIHGPYVWASWSRRYPLDSDGERIVDETARFCGWIRSATKFPVLVRLMEKTTSTNGVNSPYTTLDVWRMAKHQPSPGRAARFLLGIRRRANQILKAYGLRVSWEALGNAMQYGSIKNIGKQARYVAAYTVKQFVEGGKNSLGYFNENPGIELLIKARGLKELLETHRLIQGWALNRVNAGEFDCFRESLHNVNRLIEDNTDGVELMLDPTTEQTSFGISTIMGWNEYGQINWLVKAGDMTYHSYESWEIKREDAVKNALKAWKRQRQLEAENREFLQKFELADRCPLVYIEDSLDAGNCRPGTESWMRENGLGDKKFVGVHVLVKHMNNSRVRRVLQAVADQLAP